MSWKPPIVGGLKLNLYGSSKGNPSPAGFGCVVRDYNGNVILAICGPLSVCNSMKAEVFGLLIGLHELKSMGIIGCIVEGDSAVVTGWRLGKGIGSWELA